MRNGSRDWQESQRHLRLLKIDTLQIEHVLASDSHARSVVRGVVSRDGLPTAVDTYPTAFVCNMHTGDQPGQHWIAIYASSKTLGNTLTRSDFHHYTPLFDDFYRTIAKNGLTIIKRFKALCQPCVGSTVQRTCCCGVGMYR